MRTLASVACLVCTLAFAEPPPMADVSLKKTAKLLAANKSLTAAERETQTLIELGLMFGLDRISAPLGFTDEKLSSSPDVVFARVSWNMWGTCNKLNDEQKQKLTTLVPRFDQRRAMLLAWSQLNLGKVDEARVAMRARLEVLTRTAERDALGEASQLLQCIGPHLPTAERDRWAKRIETLSATLPLLPPG